MMENNCKLSTKIEFDVNLTCNNCAIKIEKVLSDLKGVHSFLVDVKKQSVVVETAVPSQTIKEAIESTGKIAILKGFGVSKLGSAVAEFKSYNILGVIRFHQLTQDICVIDGTVDGLPPGEHEVHIHEFGDLSNECKNIGSYFNPIERQLDRKSTNDKQDYGDLGKIIANEAGRARFYIEHPLIKVWDIIGRSIAITPSQEEHEVKETSKFNEYSSKKLLCAVIARSSGLFENPKRLCQCDGISIWDEGET